MSLYKLFHVSDLHFGEGWVPEILSHAPGWEIHDPHVISSLSHSIRDQAQRCEEQKVPYQLVCSGDLSTWGSRESIRMATDFLSDRSILPREGAPVSMPGVKSPYIPGNHDVWQGTSPLWVPAPLRKRESLDCYDRLYEQAAPKADRINSEPFPYRLTLFEDEEIVLRLYGIDSTRIDLAPSEEISTLRATLHEISLLLPLTSEIIQWLRRYLPGDQSTKDEHIRHAIAACAVGFIDDRQLVNLCQFANEEQKEFEDRKQRLIRVAMVHHPLAYPATPEDRPDWTPDTLRALLRLDKIQALLQYLEFSAVLCGHQHCGFLQKIRPDSSLLPLHVFSVGTAGQRVRLTSQERQLLRDHDNLQLGERGSLSEAQDKVLQEAQDKLNEYAVYDLLKDGNEYIWSCQASRFMPHRQNFVIQRQPDAVPVTFASRTLY